MKDIKLRLNIKTFCMYEHMTGKSYAECTTEEDLYKLLYCCIIVNNNYCFTYDVFKIMLQDRKFKSGLVSRFTDILKCYSSDAAGDGNGGGDAGYISNVAYMLIIKYHMDVHYVMYELDIWELVGILRTINDYDKAELIDKRFWTWLSMTPQIDTKKCKSPDKLLPFKWEEEEKKAAAEQELSNKQEYILNMFDRLNGKE